MNCERLDHLKRHPWTPMKMLQLAITSNYLKSITHSHYSRILAGSSLEKSTAWFLLCQTVAVVLAHYITQKSSWKLVSMVECMPGSTILYLVVIKKSGRLLSRPLHWWVDLISRCYHFDASFFWPHPLKRPDVHNSGLRLGTGHTAAENRIGTVLIFHLPEGYTEPGACNQIRYSSERYACH